MNPVKSRIRLEGGKGLGLQLEPDSLMRIINVEGSEVVDLWAYGLPTLDEYLSMEHTRSCLKKLRPAPGAFHDGAATGIEVVLRYGSISCYSKPNTRAALV
jgi:uncharacterized protein YcgI (DUF1989 family)